jgi:hypothetical protein
MTEADAPHTDLDVRFSRIRLLDHTRSRSVNLPDTKYLQDCIYKWLFTTVSFAHVYQIFNVSMTYICRLRTSVNTSPCSWLSQQYDTNLEY